MAQRKDQRPEEIEQEQQDVGLEGAAEEDSGILRHAEVEGGDEIAIDLPPSGAGGIRGSPAPNRDDIEES